jgi:catechol 2,3-dioxygenase-like lactoylglutathione lyase family enzyme
MTAAAPAAIAVDHVQLPMPPGGSAVARRFYQPALGLSEVRDPLLDRPGTLRFALGAQRLDLREGASLAIAPQTHLALRLARLPAVLARLREHGHLVDESALDDGRAYTEDPFGNRLELIALAPQAASHDAEVWHVSRLRFAH